jgi:release factor glutamine methyltransferase
MLERRRAGEPLQYVIGSWSFRTLDLFVDRRVLIPRPETEYVVERALAELDRRVGPARLAVDLGTGSGAIALALVSERRDVEVWATDVSSAALEVAQANLGGVGRVATRVRLATGAWFDALPASLAGRLDLIVSNPPYIAESETLPSEVADWEPVEALRAGARGTEALLVIVAEAPRWLAPGASVVLEMAPHQSSELVEAAQAAGLVEVEVGRDLAGRERVLIARSVD